MSSKQIRLYYKNVTAEVIGPEHGISSVVVVKFKTRQTKSLMLKYAKLSKI